MSGGERQRVDGEPAFLLHAHPYSETSLLIEVFTGNHGRLALVAKGARRPRSALRGTLIGFQPLTIGWFGGGEVKTLAKAEWAGGLPLPQGSSLMVGYYLNELLLKLLPRDDAHPMVFGVYRETLAVLATRPAEQAGPALRRFEKTLLKELGYGLSLTHEAGGGAPIAPQGRYDYVLDRGAVPSAGSEGCGQEVLGQTLLDMAADRYIDPRTAVESRNLMRRLFNHYLSGQTLQSRRIFMELQEL